MEDAFAGKYLVDNGPEGEDVRAMVDSLATNLLRRHIAGRAHDHAGIGSRGLSRRVAVAVLLGLHQLRETKVENLDAAVFGDEEVLRLEIAVNDALVVRGGQSMGDLDAVVDGFANRERAALQRMTQRFADEQFGDEVRRAVEDSELVDGKDVGVAESRSGLGFLLEAAQTVGVARNE